MTSLKHFVKHKTDAHSCYHENPDSAPSSFHVQEINNSLLTASSVSMGECDISILAETISKLDPQ